MVVESVHDLVHPGACCSLLQSRLQSFTRLSYNIYFYMIYIILYIIYSDNAHSCLELSRIGLVIALLLVTILFKILNFNIHWNRPGCHTCFLLYVLFLSALFENSLTFGGRISEYSISRTTFKKWN